MSDINDGKRDSGPAMLGRLLCDSGWITQNLFRDRLEICTQSGTPLGRTLVLQRYISGSTLSAAWEAILQVNDGTLTWDEAIGVVSAIRNRTPEEHPLSAKILQRTELRPAELLVQAGIITDFDRYDAIELAVSFGKAPNVVLVDRCMITPRLRVTSEKIGELLSAEAISREAAISAIKTAREKNFDFDELLNSLPAFCQETERGKENRQLMREAGVLQDQPVEKTCAQLIATEVLTAKLFKDATQIRKLIAAEALSRDAGLKLLDTAARMHLPLDEAAEAVDISCDFAVLDAPAPLMLPAETEGSFLEAAESKPPVPAPDPDEPFDTTRLEAAVLVIVGIAALHYIFTAWFIH